MNGFFQLSPLTVDERAMLRRNWGWFVALGLALVVMGLLGLVFVGALTLVAILFIGWIFLIGGLLEVVHAIARKGWQGFWLDLFSGLLTGIVGLLILFRPGAGASVITILLGVVFLISGVFRLGTGIAFRNPYRGWFIVQGVVAIVLGLMILADWPVSTIWLIGTLVAIDLLINGLRLASFGMAVKRLLPAGTEERLPGAGVASAPPAS